MPKIWDEPKKTKERRIEIAPITRLEGHAKINIFLNEKGNVEDAYFQVVELRGFERFCRGRPAEEMARITPRICGVCPSAHHMASTKALDAVFKVEPPEPARKLRELFYCAHIIHSHIAHFYALAAPDFVLGPATPAAKRNFLEVIEEMGVKTGKEIIKHRSYAQRIQEIIGGKATHAVCGLPGGMSKPLTEEERAEIEKMANSSVEFSKLSLEKIFTEVVLRNKEYVDLITDPELYYHETYYMGMVDKDNKVNFYDGKIRVVDPEGKEFVKFEPKDYLDVIGEKVEPWTYLKFPYLKKVGWNGLVDGKDSGIYRVNSLARLNVADGMATPGAQNAYETMYETLGNKPVHATLAFHWARLIELLYASERALELARDAEITSKELRREVGEPGEGVGCVEAPRGTLYHHYWADAEGLIEKVNLIVATTQNSGPICMSIKKAARKLIREWKVSNGLLNMVEMAFRAYDPCLACATHSLPGHMPMQVNIYDKDKNLYKQFTR